MKAQTILPVFILSFIVLFNGCDSVNEPVSVVSGKVFSRQKATLQNVKVKIGDRESVTGADGYFSIENVTIPYDVILSNDNISQKVRYNGLKSTELNLIFPFLGSSTLFRTIINIPAKLFKADRSTMLVFSDGKNINEQKLIQHQSTPQPVEMNFAFAQQSYSGRFYLLSFKEINGRIISYENFGMSDEVLVGLNGIDSYTFNDAQVYLDPSEIDINVECDIPAGQNFAFSYYYLTFSKWKNYSGSYGQWEIITEPSFTLKFPGNLPVKCYSFVATFTNAILGGGEEKFMLNPGGNNLIKLRDVPHIISPENHQTGIKLETLFSFESFQPNKIYQIIVADSAFYGPVVYQTGTRFKLNDMQELGLSINPNSNYSWTVYETGSFSSMDDFARTYFEKEESYSNYEYRYFKTAP